MRVQIVSLLLKSMKEKTSLPEIANDLKSVKSSQIIKDNGMFHFYSQNDDLLAVISEVDYRAILEWDENR